MEFQPHCERCIINAIAIKFFRNLKFFIFLGSKV